MSALLSAFPGTEALVSVALVLPGPARYRPSASESFYLREVLEKHASRVVMLPWTKEAPTLIEWLRTLTNGLA